MLTETLHTAFFYSENKKTLVKLRFSAGSCVKILLPETKLQGLAGNGEQTGRAGRRPRTAISEISGPWSICVQFCEVIFTTNPKNNFEKNKKSTGQEGASSV